ncbi:PREDICTED: protein maelstrom-like [Polistes canadensis]|uniref:protein maelstrom-like n=1 Tax=Polistes canadensis TaxID=91411 RepID=UPI000718B524|nr:PREDICTED: protein maelstrom-like [Polistes canadensis]
MSKVSGSFVVSGFISLLRNLKVKMPNKRKKRNAFFYFMLDWRKKVEKCGMFFASLKEVQNSPECSEAWQNLSSHEKQHYNDLAKKTLSDNVKLNCRGEPIELVKQKEYELAEFNRVMRNHISNTINDNLSNEKLNQVKFYFLHFNWLYITNDGIYIPVEYAIGEFTLQDGITRFHHKILNIKPKIGYAWQSTEISRNSHKILPEFSGGEKDFRRLYFEFIEFLKPGKINNEYPPLFVTKKIYDGVPSFLDQLADAADCENTFIIYSIEVLFTALRNAALIRKGIDAISESVGEQEFGMEKYMYEKNIECSYHEIIDGGSQFCSLSLIRQWSYIICDYSCDGLGIEYRPGFNCAASLSKDYIYNKLQNKTDNALKSIRFDNPIEFSKIYRQESFGKIKEVEEEESSKCREDKNKIQRINNCLPVAAAYTKNISNENPFADFADLKIRIGRGRAKMLSNSVSPKVGIGRGRNGFSE